MIQQLQLMVVLKQKEIKEEEQKEEGQRQKERDTEEKEERQNKWKEEEIGMIKTWSKEESQKYVERFREYKGDTRCRKCGWFGHMAHHCRRMEIKAEREQRGGLCENRWELLRCRVITCDEERMATHSTRKETLKEGQKEL